MLKKFFKKIRLMSFKKIRRHIYVLEYTLHCLYNVDTFNKVPVENVVKLRFQITINSVMSELTLYILFGYDIYI